MKVQPIRIDMISVDNSNQYQTNVFLSKMEKISQEDITSDLNKDRIELHPCDDKAKGAIEEIERIEQSEPIESLNTSSNDNNSIFYTSYADGRMLHKMFQYEKALEKYKMVLQCKYRTIQSEPVDIKEKFCSVLYYIGRIHLESEMDDDKVKGFEALHFCLTVRRSCFGSSHISVAIVLVELASIHADYFEHQYALDLLLEALSIALNPLPNDSPNSELLCDIWYAMGTAHRALGHDGDAQSAFEEASKLR
jgi:tetratricopeptide (TPR) repeat protein